MLAVFRGQLEVFQSLYTKFGSCLFILGFLFNFCDCHKLFPLMFMPESLFVFFGVSATQHGVERDLPSGLKLYKWITHSMIIFFLKCQLFSRCCFSFHSTTSSAHCYFKKFPRFYSCYMWEGEIWWDNFWLSRIRISTIRL